MVNDITITSNGNQLRIGGVISGARRLTKAGTGTLFLNGTNTYSGGFQLDAGTITIASNAALGAATGTVTINGGTVNVSGNRTTLNNPHVWNNSFSYTGPGTLNFGTGAKIMNANITITSTASTLTIGGVISGNFRLTKAGAGIMALTGANTLTGGITHSAGTLNLNNNAALGATAGTFIINSGTVINVNAARTLANNNPVQINGNFTFTGTNTLTFGTSPVSLLADATITASASTLTFGGIMSGGFRLTKAGNGALTLSGANTHSGITLNAGTLNINNSNALGDGASAFIINGGTINNSSAAAITTLDYPITWNSNFTFTGTRVLNFGAGAITMTVPTTITASAQTLTFGGVISGAFRLTKSGNGALTLAGANTYSGGTTLNAGTLNINHSSALGALSANPFIINAGTINNNSGAAISTLNYPMTWNSDFTFTGTNDLNLGTGAVNLSASRILTVSASNLTVGGIISGASFSLTKVGNGALTLSGANTYNGGTTLTAGTLNINHASALGTVSANPFTISGGIINNTSGSPITLLAYPIAWNGNFTFTGSSSLNLGAGAITLSANRTVTVAANVLTVPGAIGGAFTLTKAGNGELTLNAANTHSSTTLSAGILNLGNPSALGTAPGVFTINGGTIDNTSGSPMTLDNYPISIGGNFTFRGTQNLNTGLGAITLTGNRTINCTTSGSELIVCNVISGAFRLTKSGAGTLTLCGENLFSGGTTLNAGQLNINHPQALGTVDGTFTVNGGAYDNTSGADITTIDYPQSWNGSYTFIGTYNINFGNGPVSINSNLVITVATAGQEIVFCDVVSGTSSLEKAGPGVLTLCGDNTYTGGTKLTEGVLNINSPTALGATASTFTISAGTTIDNTSGAAITLTNNNPIELEGDFTFQGTQDLFFGSGAVTLTADATITTTTVGKELSLCGVISGAFKLTKQGAGTLTLCGDNTYSGGTDLGGGRLNLNHERALGDAGGLFTIQNGTTLDNTSGSTITLSNNNAMTWSGNYSFLGTNDLHLGSGAISFTTNPTISVAGNLTVAGTIDEAARHFTKDGAGELRFANQSITLRNLTISNGTLLGTAGQFVLTENLINNGTYQHNNGSVLLNGAAAQTFSGSGNNHFYSMELDNGNGLTMNTTTTVANQLTLTDGIIVANSLLVIQNGASASAGSSTNFVTGTMRKIGNQDFTFPLGEAGVWAPLEIRSFTAGDATTQFDAKYRAAQPNNVSSADILSPLKRVSFVEYWDLSHTGGTAPIVTVTLHWKDEDRSGTIISGNATNANLVVAHWNGTQWESKGQSSVSLGATGYVVSNQVNSFSPFTFGADGGDYGDIPLSVDIASFTGRKVGTANELNWSTANETNNEYFEIQRSSDGLAFLAVGKVKGGGNSSELVKYTFVDKTPVSGSNYYRLLHMDYDQESTFSDVILIENTNFSGFTISPNPMGPNQKLRVSYKGQWSSSGKVEILINDAGGKLLSQFSLTTDSFDNGEFMLPMDLAAGTYKVKITHDQEVKHFQLVVR